MNECVFAFRGGTSVVEYVLITRAAAHPAIAQVFLAARAPVCARCATTKPRAPYLRRMRGRMSNGDF